MQELGYVEGRSAVIEWRWWEGKTERLRDAIAEMVRINPDVIVVGGSEATNAMKEAIKLIPIVNRRLGDPVADTADNRGKSVAGTRPAYVLRRRLSGCRTMQTANALGLTFPRSLLPRENEVIQ